MTLLWPWFLPDNPGILSWSIEAISPELWKYKLTDCELPKISFQLSQNIVCDSNVDSFHFRKYRYNVISVIHLLRLMGGILETLFLDTWWGICSHPFSPPPDKAAILLLRLKNLPVQEGQTSFVSFLLDCLQCTQVSRIYVQLLTPTPVILQHCGYESTFLFPVMYVGFYY